MEKKGYREELERYIVRVAFFFPHDPTKINFNKKEHGILLDKSRSTMTRRKYKYNKHGEISLREIVEQEMERA